jgi:hypothetical protein
MKQSRRACVWIHCGIKRLEVVRVEGKRTSGQFYSTVMKHVYDDDEHVRSTSFIFGDTLNLCQGGSLTVGAVQLLHPSFFFLFFFWYFLVGSVLASVLPEQVWRRGSVSVSALSWGLHHRSWSLNNLQ